MKIRRVTKRSAMMEIQKTFFIGSDTGLDVRNKRMLLDKARIEMPYLAPVSTANGRTLHKRTYPVPMTSIAGTSFIYLYLYRDTLNRSRELKQRIDAQALCGKLRMHDAVVGGSHETWIDFSEPGEQQRLRSMKDLRFI